MNVKCNKAGNSPVCSQCEHSVPHSKVIEDEGNYCTKWSKCGELAEKVRCTKVKE